MFQQPFVLNIKQSSGVITLMMGRMIMSCKMLTSTTFLNSLREILSMYHLEYCIFSSVQSATWNPLNPKMCIIILHGNFLTFLLCHLFTTIWVYFLTTFPRWFPFLVYLIDYVNHLTLMNDQDRISPYNINTIGDENNRKFKVFIWKAEIFKIWKKKFFLWIVLFFLLFFC